MGKVYGNTHTRQQLNNYANQRNSNNSAYRANNNNHANQLNPNNQANKSGKSSKQNFNLLHHKASPLIRLALFIWSLNYCKIAYYYNSLNIRVYKKLSGIPLLEFRYADILLFATLFQEVSFQFLRESIPDTSNDSNRLL